MAALMLTLTLIALLVGPSLLIGQPMLIAVGIVLAGAVLIVTRRAAALSRRR
jgi:hypothetical protein